MYVQMRADHLWGELIVIPECLPQNGVVLEESTVVFYIEEPYQGIGLV